MQAPTRLTNPTVIAMAAYLLAVPLLLSFAGSDWSSYDAARVAQLVLFPVIAALGIRSALPSIPRHVQWAVCALAALGLLSCGFAANPWMALREFLNLASLLAMGAVLAAQRDDALQWLPKVAAVAVMAYALPTLGLALMGAAQGLPLAADLPLPGFANRRYFNHVQTVALPLAVYGVVAFRSRPLRLLTGAGLLASMVLLWITMGRGSLLGFAASLVVLGMLWMRGHREARPLFLLFFGGLAFAAVLAFVVQAAAVPLAQESGMWRAPADLELSSDHSRFGLWQRAWNLAVASPLLGAGPMHYAFGNHEKATHPHSLPLQLLAEWGFPATLLIGLIWVWLMLAMVRRLRNSTGTNLQLGIGLLACWAAVFVDSWFSGLWVMPVSQTWLVAMLGLTGAWLAHHEQPKAPPLTRRWNVLPLLLSGALLLHALPELVQHRAHVEMTKKDFPSEGARPRFWWYGNFGLPSSQSSAR